MKLCLRLNKFEKIDGMKIIRQISWIIFFLGVLILTNCKKKPVIPEVTTSEVTSIGLTTATGGGNVTSDGNSEVTSKGISFTPFIAPTSSDKTTNDGHGTGSFKSMMTGLRPGTNYYVRAFATNAAGTQYGQPVTFRTAGTAPEVAVDNFEYTSTNISATLHARVNSMGLNTTVTFEYGMEFPLTLSVGATQNPLISNYLTDVSATVTSLTPYTQYYYVVKASNELGTTSSRIINFMTQGWPPIIRSFSLTDITRNSVNVRSIINPGLLPTTTSIEYGLTENYGTSVLYPQNPLDGDSDIVIEKVIDNLKPGTTYYFRIKSFNEAGISFGNKLYCITNN
jgi:hypothetical protein